jgi:hypothetical protein
MMMNGGLLRNNPKKSLKLLLKRQNQTIPPIGEIMISRINQPQPQSQFQR